MIRPESIKFHPEMLAALRKLVARGESQQLEFKRKASYPDKIVREIIAFANTDGGILLIGVDDDKSIPGVKFPEEESVVIKQELAKHCRPSIVLEETVIPLSEKRFVLQWKIPRSERRPHFYVQKEKRISFVRKADQSLLASREMCEILRRSRAARGTQFTYGTAEEKLMHALDSQPFITLREFSKLTGLNRFLASRKLVRLALANVIRITPTEKGDLFSRM